MINDEATTELFIEMIIDGRRQAILSPFQDSMTPFDLVPPRFCPIGGSKPFWPVGPGGGSMVGAGPWIRTRGPLRRACRTPLENFDAAIRPSVGRPAVMIAVDPPSLMDPVGADGWKGGMQGRVRRTT
jgi:hypothetical protein